MDSETLKEIVAIVKDLALGDIPISYDRIGDKECALCGAPEIGGYGDRHFIHQDDCVYKRAINLYNDGKLKAE